MTGDTSDQPWYRRFAHEMMATITMVRLRMWNLSIYLGGCGGTLVDNKASGTGQQKFLRERSTNFSTVTASDAFEAVNGEEFTW